MNHKNIFHIFGVQRQILFLPIGFLFPILKYYHKLILMLLKTLYNNMYKKNQNQVELQIDSNFLLI